MLVQPELKIIADHLRSSSFLIADGVLPSNEGRGYVLRRIMRRAMRQLHKLGAREASMYKLVDALINEMGAAYPELSRARAVIVETLKNEEEKFRETLEKGLKILDEEIEKTKSKKFPGAIAFKLYDTFGFPLDLTQDILKEKNLEVDIEEFNSEMEAQRTRAKANWKGSGETAEETIFFDLKEKFGETKFLGYETLSTKAKVLAIYPNFIILDQTPFYATSGGQKGDDGKIGNVKISETKKFAGNLFVHFFSSQDFTFKVGDEVEATVNSQTRNQRAQNHSATHLMHKALKEVLGNSISQKGSNVDTEGFTFDFNFNRAMTVEEIQKVENLVNQNINQCSAVETKLMDLEAARNSGAEALFGEKYDAKVRVVAMGNSIELCGGTHVKNVSEIGIFKVVSEKSIASGIRRIEAKSGDEAKKYLEEKEAKLKNAIDELHQKILIKSDEIVQLGGVRHEEIDRNESDQKLLEDVLKKREKEVERLKKEMLLNNLNHLAVDQIGNKILISHTFDDLEAKDLREIANEVIKKSDIVALFGSKDGKVSVCVAVAAKSLDNFDATKLIAPLVEKIGGKGGGGKKDFAMGGGINKEGIPEAIETLRNLIK
jgi:alanyl-tRNA synthetase